MTTKSAKTPVVRLVPQNCSMAACYMSAEDYGTKVAPLTDAVPDGIDSISATYERGGCCEQSYQVTYRTGNKPYTFDLNDTEGYPYYVQIERRTDDNGTELPLYPLQEEAADWLRQNIGYYDRPSIIENA